MKIFIFTGVLDTGRFLFLFIACIMSALMPTSEASASSFSFKTGPFAAGNGGTNPAAVPPVNPADWELTYVTEGDFETSFSVIPGLLVGKRFREDNYYVSLGGGGLIGVNGAGAGVYTAFGYVTGEKRQGWHFNFEYKQTAGYSPSTKRFMSPSALRVGIIWDW